MIQIRLRHSIVRNLIKSNVLSLDYVTSKKNIVDPLTKGLYSFKEFLSSKGQTKSQNNSKLLYTTTIPINKINVERLSLELLISS